MIETKELIGKRVRAKRFWIRRGCYSDKVGVVISAEVVGNANEESIKTCGVGTDQDVYVVAQYSDGQKVRDRLNMFEEIPNP